ncbi:MAG TPA: recombinase family protein [Pirellulales bacterium]|nr:recombinase family protein [Pirellulales bacterium]
MYEAFERIASNQAPWRVAQWLITVGLPKPSNSTLTEWTAENVLTLARSEVYRGVEFWGKTETRRLYRAGRKVTVPRPEAEVPSRSMEHLRIVPDWLWHGANQAISNRNTNPRRGEENPLWGISRDRRGPLSNNFECVCGARMHVDGRADGGYRCSVCKKGRCWNKATALRELTHSAISKAVVEKLLSMDGALDAIVQHIQALYAEDSPRRQRETELRTQGSELERICQRLVRAIESSDDPPESTLERLKAREEELTEVRIALGELEEAKHQERPDITAAEIRERLQDCTA